MCVLLCVCLPETVHPLLSCLLSLSICLLISIRALRVNVLWMRSVASLWCVCVGVYVVRCVFVRVVGVLLKSSCCLPLRQCLVFAAQSGWTGSPSPLLPASLSPPITFPIGKLCRMTTRRDATTCCHTLTWRGNNILGFGYNKKAKIMCKVPFTLRMMTIMLTIKREFYKKKIRNRRLATLHLRIH